MRDLEIAALIRPVLSWIRFLFLRKSYIRTLQVSWLFGGFSKERIYEGRRRPNFMALVGNDPSVFEN